MKLIVFAVVLVMATSAYAEEPLKSDCQLTWTKYENFHVNGGTLQPGITTESQCKKLCARTEDCWNLDFDSSDNSCWTGSERNPAGRIRDENVIHWDLQCTVCPLDFDYSASTKLCFKIITKLHTAEDAARACQELEPSARLVSIANSNEQNILKGAINALSVSELATCHLLSWTVFYTSGERKNMGNPNSPFVWRPGQGLNETDVSGILWGPTQPDVNEEDCLGLFYQDSLNVHNFPCAFPGCPICQV